MDAPCAPPGEAPALCAPGAWAPPSGSRGRGDPAGPAPDRAGPILCCMDPRRKQKKARQSRLLLAGNYKR
eukprot:4508373-Lingulodinium_polyedra.AAC.1